MNDKDTQDLLAAIAALEAQRATLGDAVLALATAPLRARLAGLLHPSGLQLRQVTVLFADVVGSTAMAQGLRAEDTLNVLGRAMHRMADIVQAHQGRVLRFTGDGVKAAFGMDEAREDDAERAVRAGLAMLAAGLEQAEQDRVAYGIDDFAMRVGLHTGDVALGAGIDADNTAMGAAVNIAARMEQTALPGTLRISHDTWSQVRGLFEFDVQPPLQVKGIDAPMQTYLVRGALERSAASVERGLLGLTTPMVGRDAELQRLLDAGSRARETRQLQALTLLGDAGLGKSRLLREFTATLVAQQQTQPQDCRLLTLRSQPDGQLRLFGLLRALLATQCGMADTDSAEVARRKVVDGLSAWFDERGERGERGQRGERQAQLIGQLSGLDYADSPTVKGLDPRSLRDQAFAAVRAYLQALAAQGALPVLLVEDLHWADDGSLDLLQHLLAHAAELPLALVMTARPALLARRPDWAAPETTVQLSPLPSADSDTLAAALLRRIDPLPSKLTEIIVGRAEGNPYYMEELVRRLIDDGVIVVGDLHWTVHADRLDTLHLPTTLVGLLQARLDALPASERQAARQASIVGHVFWDDALQVLDANAPQALPALQRAAFVKARDSSDFEGTPERQFDHHLLHQVTYDTLLKAERKLGHGAAARWLAERTKGRGAEFLAMTGEHAEKAGETALAIDCFEQAGAEAQKRFANVAAVVWLRRALGLLAEAEPTRRFELLNRLEEIASIVGDKPGQAALHQEVAAILERHPDDTRQAQLWFDMALLADRRSDVAVAEKLSLQALELAQRCGAAIWVAMAAGNLAYRHFDRQDYAGAEEHLELALRWARKIEAKFDRDMTEAKLLTISAMVLEGQCRLSEARETLLAVLLRGVALDSRRLQLAAIDNLANIAGIRGRWDERADWGQRMLDLANSIGAVPQRANAQHHLALAAQCQGDVATTLLRSEQALASARAIGNRRVELATMQMLGEIHASSGDTVTARQWLVQAQALSRELQDPVGQCRAAAREAACDLKMEQPETVLSTVVSLLDRQGTDLAGCAAHETIGLRWTCQQVFDALGDARGAPLLDQLFIDVQARATAISDADDRDRLIQAIPDFRDIVAAYQRRGARDQRNQPGAVH